MELSRAKQVLGTSGKGLLVARNIPSFGTEEIKKIDLLLQHKIILQWCKQNYFITDSKVSLSQPVIYPS